MRKATFTNDNNVQILTSDNNENSNVFCLRDNHEVVFRKIITLLINKDVINRNKNIIDLGCWIGDNAIPWSKNIVGTVYAIDPSEKNLNFINELIELNNIKNVTLIKEAIADCKKIISTDHGLEHCSFSDGALGKNVITSTSLDILQEEKIIEDVTFIHLDVEGMESMVLQGAKNIINFYMPVIAFEQHLETDNFKETSNFLISKGYNVFLINEILPGCRPDCRNFLAFPSNLTENAISILFDNFPKQTFSEIK